MTKACQLYYRSRVWEQIARRLGKTKYVHTSASGCAELQKAHPKAVSVSFRSLAENVSTFRDGDGFRVSGVEVRGVACPFADTPHPRHYINLN